MITEHLNNVVVEDRARAARCAVTPVDSCSEITFATPVCTIDHGHLWVAGHVERAVKGSGTHADVLSMSGNHAGQG